jgi:hypothetical protein
MKTSENKKLYGSRIWLTLVIAGVMIFITGLLLRIFLPGTITDTRILEGLGIFFAGCGIVPLVRYISARRNPVAGRRAQLAEEDERAIALRNQAAYIAFLFTLVTTSIVLIGYSAYTRGQNGFDPVWFTLALLVIIPVLVFIGVLSWLNRS